MTGSKSRRKDFLQAKVGGSLRGTLFVPNEDSLVVECSGVAGDGA